MSTIDTISEPVCRRTDEGGRSGRPGRNLFGAFWRWFSELPARRITRRGLLELSDDQLKDIGISRAEAYRWGLRPFWD